MFCSFITTGKKLSEKLALCSVNSSLRVTSFPSNSVFCFSQSYIFPFKNSVFFEFISQSYIFPFKKPFLRLFLWNWQRDIWKPC
ncbi:hypothetical protein CPC197_1429 [Chlamydia psittaci C1/97]|nr:hypothetical protein CPC197_1429 [Chlamydia psittaci C1/97]